MKNQQQEIELINNALRASINPNESNSCIFPRALIEAMKSVNADSVIHSMKAPALQKEYFSEGYSQSIFEKTANGKDQYAQAHLNALQIAVSIKNEAPLFYDEMKKFSRIVHEASKQVSTSEWRFERVRQQLFSISRAWAFQQAPSSLSSDSC